MTIYFYTKNDRFGDFSNFSPHGIKMNELWWPTVEHYFQAQKFTDTDYIELIRKAYTPKRAAELGRSRKLPIKHNWGEIKDNIMFEAVLKKFQTHKKLAQILIETGNQDIVENAPGDYYWGCGADGSGLNKLGEILVKVREMIQQ
ncbi:MAG: NADAR family protein [Microcoleaceae cyanobacterium]